MDRGTCDSSRSLDHQERDPCHDEETIRAWIRHGRDCFWENVFTLLSLDDETNVADRTSGDFVRVVFGHIVLDQYWRKYKLELESGEKSSDDVVKMAFDKFLSQGYDSARLRHVKIGRSLR